MRKSEHRYMPGLFADGVRFVIPHETVYQLIYDVIPRFHLCGSCLVSYIRLLNFVRTQSNIMSDIETIRKERQLEPHKWESGITLLHAANMATVTVVDGMT